MRAGGCAVQQGLSSEAADLVKQAVVLAKRRGHAQVTPLHVANAMLAAPTGLLRVACQRLNSHPLQCKALELCFNVALNRLPASSPGPMMSPHHHHQPQYPSISNALVAAFKRAQAHQRRGSVENQPQQQQPLLNSKIELEQLVISILDDPSVSRVMREAGFSSTQVKSNLEKAVLLPNLRSPSSSPPPPCNKSVKGNKPFLSLQASPLPINQQHPGKINSPQNDDVDIIIETLLTNRKRRSLVIVGESISATETTVKHLMERVDRGNVPEGLKEVKFISIPPLHSFCNLQMDTVEQKMEELACLVKRLVTKGVVLYLGDLKIWVNEYNDLEKERSYSSAVEHMIMELGRLVGKIEETGRLWLMGIATFQTYMKCRNGYHSLEGVWRLHPITIPSNSLELSLISPSESKKPRSENGLPQEMLTDKDRVNVITCCAECSSKFEDEARSLKVNEPTLSSQLPPWLKDERRRLCNDERYSDSIRNLRMKWNSYCGSVHNQRTLITLIGSGSASPSSSMSVFSFDKLQNPNTKESHLSLTMESIHHGSHGWASDPAHIQGNGQGEHVISSTETSPSPIEAMNTTNYPKKFREFNARNLNGLCDALEEKIPWQSEIIPEIAGTVLECRSGMLRRKHRAIIGSSGEPKEDTWLLFLGPDHDQSKQKISQELAKLVFGSYASFASIRTTNSINSPEDNHQVRVSCGKFIETFAQAVSADPNRVFLVEDLEKADYSSRMGIIRAIETGRMRRDNGDEVRFWDAIVVLSCNRFNPGSAEEVLNQTSENAGGTGEDQAAAGNPCLALDLNITMDEDSDLGIVENIVDRRVVFRTCLGDVKY